MADRFVENYDIYGRFSGYLAGVGLKDASLLFFELLILLEFVLKRYLTGVVVYDNNTLLEF